MPKRNLILFLAAFVLPAIFGNAQQKQFLQIKQTPVHHTAPTSGKEMYEQYCASCHGLDGKGNGPATPALKQTPVDLTMLASKNGGKFPDDHVISVLRFGVETPAHGSQAMPIWGPVLRSLNHSSDIELQQRISNITHYLKTMQVK